MQNIVAVQSFIFIKRFDTIGDWEILTIFNRSCQDLQQGIEFVRRNSNELSTNVGLATFDQMLLDNTEWDNF